MLTIDIATSRSIRENLQCATCHFITIHYSSSKSFERFGSTLTTRHLARTISQQPTFANTSRTWTQPALSAFQETFEILKCLSSRSLTACKWHVWFNKQCFWAQSCLSSRQYSKKERYREALLEQLASINRPLLNCTLSVHADSQLCKCPDPRWTTGC